MTGLLERLQQRQAAEVQRLADLRSQLESVQARVTAAEERVARLAIAQEEVLALDQESVAAVIDQRAGSGTDQGDLLDEGDLPAETGDDRRRRPPRRRLSQVDEQVVVMLAGRGQAMRARQVAVALGEPDKRGRVEVMRSRLKRLTTNGWLVEQEQGLFCVAAGVQVPAGGAQAGTQADTPVGGPVDARVDVRVNGFAGRGGVKANG